MIKTNIYYLIFLFFFFLNLKIKAIFSLILKPLVQYYHKVMKKKDLPYNTLIIIDISCIVKSKINKLSLILIIINSLPMIPFIPSQREPLSLYLQR